MSTFHVERGIQFKPELYRAADRSNWFKAMGEELAAKKLTITLAPGIEVKNADEAVALYKRYQTDRAGLQAAIGLPAGTTLQNYFSDLIQAMDDAVKATSDVKDKKLDFGPSSEMGKLLGMETKSTYSSTTTQFGKAPAGQVFSVLGVQISKSAAAVDPLKDKVYMDSTTFASMPSYQWARDSVELEQVMGVTGADSKELLKALRQTNAAGRTTFARLKKPEVCEAFTVGYSGIPMDEVKWDNNSHKMREKNKFVSLTIESGRFEADAATGKREISVGTDKMDDTYYDTAKYDLFKNDYSVRGRARWDTDSEIRRILVGVKANTVIDEFGLKRNDKVDVRNDGASAEEIASLDQDVRRGKTKWNGSEEAVKPLKGLYDGLNAKGLLPDVGPHQDVLLLEPKVHVRSVRSRYHLNETELSGIQGIYKDAGLAKLQGVVDQAAKIKASLSGGDLKLVTDIETAAKGLLDNSAIAKAAEAELKKLDPAMTVTADSIKTLLPDLTRSSWGSSTTTDFTTLEKKRVVAETIDKLFHDFSGQLDGARRALCGAQDRALEAHPDFYMAYVKSVEKPLANKTTHDAFLARHDKLTAGAPADLAKEIQGFNDFGNKQKADGNRDFRDFKPVDEAQFKGMRAQILNEVVRINQRQLEAAGSSARGMWFDEAREFYVPSSSRNTGNFLIDTTDMSEFVKHADWESIPADKRTPKDLLPEDKVFHTMLVNETQIELGLEKPYLDRMAELAKAIHTDEASLVMKFFASNGTTGLDPANGATYHAALQGILTKPAAERDAAVTALNAFMKTQNSALAPVTAESLKLLDLTMFTPANRDKAVRTTPDLERNLAGAKFIFQQYRDIQADVVKAKGERVLRTLENAGLRNLEWKQTETSKGNTAMEILSR